jgi:CheY-like chemotaxis protein
MTPKVLNVKDHITLIRRMLVRVIGEDIDLRTIIDENTGNIWADPGQIEQVLLNLAVNARDAMPRGGTLTVEAGTRELDDQYVQEHPGSVAGTFVRIDVSDTGTGMGPETLAHLYEPFFTTKETGKGTGLGLSTVFGIVKQSGGYITCYSEVGKGTTFSVYLPLTLDRPEQAPDIAESPGVKRGGETILVVEDEVSVRRFTRAVLERAGYVVIEAGGGDEALFEASKHGEQVKLLVTDVVMPRMGGRDLARRMEEINPSLRVLYVSGYTSDAIFHRDILEAGVDFVQKPFSSREFLVRVREILDR